MMTSNRETGTQNLTLPLFNLSCSSGDALTVERLLAQMPGVIDVYANPATEMAYIKYDEALTNQDQLAAVIAQAGFGLEKEDPIESSKNE